MTRMVAAALSGLIASLAIAGCTPGPPGRGGASAIGTIKLGIEFPLSGDDAPEGIAAKNGVELAIAESGPVCGAAIHKDACYRLQSAGFDDAAAGIHDPAVGAKNVQALAADPLVLGVVGPLYDSLARSELPIANAAHLTMVSPANTDECLTQEPADGHCHGLAARLRPRGPNNYFRVVTTRIAEGAAAADFAFRTLGRRRAVVVSDQTSAGEAIAQAFKVRFQADGGTVDSIGFNPREPGATGSLAERVAQPAPDVVYFAGTDIDTAAQLRVGLANMLPQAPLLGSGRLGSSQFARMAGARARGTYYTLVGGVVTALSPAQAFLRAYRRSYGQDPGLLSLPTFDATNVLIGAASRAIDDAGGKLPRRDQVLTEMGRTNDYRGAMGPISFDLAGDTTLKLVAVYEWMAATDPAGRFVAQISVR